ncbi:hypothetical protein [Aliarcobacter cryaerophilus]|uniref:hypothetical protein n=1 Tax=Aliarcobacter cryaerophilus TaxID=28198 RepID=UPI003DA4D6FE
MLPVLPFLIGGALGAVAGVALKKYYDENDIEIHEKLENSLMNIEEWLDEKLVALDKYKDSLNLNDDENTISLTSKEHILKKLESTKQKVYHDSFVDFMNFYKKLNNVDLGELEFTQVIFISKSEDYVENEITEENLKIAIDLLFKANNILSDIVLNLNKTLKDNYDYKSFDIKEQELIKEAFLLAKFIQKVCIDDDLAEDVIVKFNNIISNIEERV